MKLVHELPPMCLCVIWQLVVDTTLVSPLRGDGSPRPNGAVRDGVVLQAARRRKERTYPELVGPRARALLVWLNVDLLATVGRSQIAL